MHQAFKIWMSRIGLFAALLLAGTATQIQAAKKCYDCHKDAKTAFSSKKVIHSPVKAENCESCHKRHGFSNKLVLVSVTNDLCYSCHADIKEKFTSGKVHFPVASGACWDCHNPHASDKPALLVKGREGADDMYSCLMCHDELTPLLKEAKYPHEPFRKEQCNTCHDAHSSAQADLLKSDASSLCASCHKVQDKAFIKAHADKHTQGLGCVDCHTGHSSNNAHLMSERGHPPFVEGSCDACHSLPDEAGKVTWSEGVTAGSVCANCHSDQVDATKKKVPHPAVEENNCDNCHVAHASQYPKLLKDATTKICTECHSDVLTGDSLKMVHQPAMAGNCGACHEVHGSDNEKLLKHADASLCLGCHTDFAAKRDSAKVQHAAAEDCLQCHSPHESANARLLREDPIKTCTTCHDPASDVNNAESAHEPYKVAACNACHNPHFSNNDHLTRETGSKLCLTCHSDIGKRLAMPNVHPPATDDCLTCHVPHVSKQPYLQTAKTSELCESCHDASSLGADKSYVHPPVKEGDCTGCHNPHGSTLPKLIAGRTQVVQVGEVTVGKTPALSEKRSDLCYTCHEAAEETFRKQVVHDPVVKGNCGACHSSHGSDHRAFTKAAPAEMCGSCHTLDEALSAKHDGYTLTKADCLDCHNPHASDQPKLARANNHPPFDEKSCESCHTRGADGSLQLAGSLTEVCSTCHDVLSTDMAKKHQHPPFASGECAGCHNMHASDHTKLLKGEGNDVCLDCHDNIRKLGKEPIQHRPFVEGNCRDCHSPHASDNAKLTTKPAESFCLSCHTTLKDDMAKGTVHEPAKTGECTACHLPHAGPNKALLVATKQELCASCHELTSPALVKAHFGFNIAKVDCQNCHAPHVAKKTSRALLLPSEHAPFTARDCNQCHQPSGDRALLAPRRTLCLDCHSSFEARLTKAVVHPPAADAEGCTSCHGPHVGFGKDLQKKDGVNTCLTCHKGKEFTGAFKHKPAFESGCTTCHDPHSSPNQSLLSKPDVMTLCIGCHANAQKTHYHPMGKGVINPRTKQDLNCVGCHSPHSSDFKPLMLADKTRKLCLNCHDLNH